MIDSARILAVIPARGGSRGLPGKNTRILGDRPLIAWTIEAASRSLYIDRLVLSSDSEEIAEVAKSWGCEVPFLRSGHISGDETPMAEVIIDACQRCRGFDYILTLQPTSPMRTREDIDGALEAFHESGADFCTSVTVASETPFWMYTIESNFLQPLFREGLVTRRQDLPTVFRLNGALYIARKNALLKEHTLIGKRTIPYELPPGRSLDIDTLEDFQEAERKIQELYND